MNTEFPIVIETIKKRNKMPRDNIIKGSEKVDLRRHLKYERGERMLGRGNSVCKSRMTGRKKRQARLQRWSAKAEAGEADRAG